MPAKKTRFDATSLTIRERPDVDAFLAEIERVCRRHGMSIGHEDGEGAFEVRAYDPELAQWLGNANACLPVRDRCSAS